MAYDPLKLNSYDPYRPNRIPKPSTFYDPNKFQPVNPKPVTFDPLSPLHMGKQIMNQLNPPIHKPLI